MWGFSISLLALDNNIISLASLNFRYTMGPLQYKNGISPLQNRPLQSRGVRLMTFIYIMRMLITGKMFFVMKWSSVIYWGLYFLSHFGPPILTGRPFHVGHEGIEPCNSDLWLPEIGSTHPCQGTTGEVGVEGAGGKQQYNVDIVIISIA